MRIAFATTATEVVGDGDVDRPLHDAAFARAGVDLDHPAWHDPSVAWDGYDLVVIRSTWDYVERLAEFRAWLAQVHALGSLRNPGPLVEWNLDKRYLLDLAAEGVPTIPTRIVRDPVELDCALGLRPGELVVKPVVSAGGRRTGRFRADDPRARELGATILTTGSPAMVQPAVASVSTEGEVGVVVFDGTVSHAFRKGPVLGPGGERLAAVGREAIEAARLTPAQCGIVDEVVRAVDRRASRLGLDTPLLYQRIDLVRLDDGRDAILEVELAEPSFFLPVDEAAADRFAAAVGRHCDRWKAGPARTLAARAW